LDGAERHHERTEHGRNLGVPEREGRGAEPLHEAGLPRAHSPGRRHPVPTPGVEERLPHVRCQGRPSPILPAALLIPEAHPERECFEKPIHLRIELSRRFKREAKGPAALYIKQGERRFD
jgi:hypothetical protein